MVRLIAKIPAYLTWGELSEALCGAAGSPGELHDLALFPVGERLRFEAAPSL